MKLLLASLLFSQLAFAARVPANYVLAGPGAGPSAVEPTYRPLVTADLPPGTTTNNNAPAGNVGEVASVSRVASAATSVTTNTALNVTSAALSLTAGDWDVTGTICFVAAATTSVTMLTSSVSLTSATLPAANTAGVPTGGEYQQVFNTAATVPTGTICQVIPPVRQSLSGTTSIYAVAKATFTVSTLTVYGSLQARRVR